ncbi:hypothetical protein BS47DRAFT_1341268 [Hydnum rufescens UP504]|uniref:Protein ARV n=1 Tax=Hydnum rufescens UP504 TaxID=1448309 RepID=A0A9P6B458_9AGAM|nr:hypothetical protein BS47DRAFT_1341268 [Hydnum rufescens UP504]
MPLCTTCTKPAEYLYTVYQSESNLRLSQCVACLSFTDPYVEHDLLTIVLDLILLKQGVYRHLLFNRASQPRRVTESNDSASASVDNASDKKIIWKLCVKLGAALIFLDAYIRWSYRYPISASTPAFWTWASDAGLSFIRISIACLIESIAFHAAITLACWIVLSLLKHRTLSSTRQQLRLSHIPLVLFYSSLTKLSLLLLLSIWRPASPSSGSSFGVPESATWYSWVQTVMEAFDEDKLDREWVVRNMLGGMAAGFGLRVALDCHPLFTTGIVVFGWGVKTVVASFVRAWVDGAGGDGLDSQRWITYSIP